jgi:DNA-binding NarL/FixJ family response regulator
MDMTGGYPKSVRQHAPQATICIDPYHVVQLANQALDEIRRAYWNEPRSLGDQNAAKRFKDARWSLLKKPEKLTDKQAATLARLKTAGGESARTARLQLSATGYARRQIAEEIKISEATVKTHFEHIYRKLGVPDRASAAAEALRQGVIH